MFKIFVTRKIPGNHLEKLKKAGFDVAVSQFDRILSPEELIEKAKGADGLLTLLIDKIDGDVIDAVGPNLKIISNYAVGFDNINIQDATARGVVVTNTPSEVVNESVAEHTWSLILALANRIVEADEALRRGAFKGWEPDNFLGVNLTGKTLGILGLGSIGSMVARRAKGWKMKILYYCRNPLKDKEKELGVEYAPLDKLLKESDFVSLHVPLTDETRHMINKKSLKLMRKNSYIINTARGAVISEEDLIEALKEKLIKGAGLDVFENEPRVAPELIKMQNVILTPHIASATNEARDKMGEMAVDAIIAALNGKKPQNIVDEKVWKNRRK